MVVTRYRLSLHPTIIEIHAKLSYIEDTSKNAASASGDLTGTNGARVLHHRLLRHLEV